MLRGPLATTVHLRPAPSSGGGAKQPRRFPDDLLAPSPYRTSPRQPGGLFYRLTKVIEGAVAGTQVRLVGRVGNRRAR